MSKTELMDIGEHCAFCGQIDFLPFRCSCKSNFCSQHRSPESHNCVKLSTKLDNAARMRSTIDTSKLPPASTLFPDRKNIKITLKTTETNPTTIKKSLEVSNKTSALYKLKKFFQVRTKEKKSNPSKRIIELSQLKTKAKGDPKIPTSERVYIWVQVVDDESKFASIIKNPMFISRGWPLGRGLDSLANTLGLKNLNNRTNDQSQKLFLFKDLGNDTFIKLNTSDRCSQLKDNDTVFIVRGTEL